MRPRLAGGAGVPAKPLRGILSGISEFTVPPDMRDMLLEFQSAAVRIAARHQEKRGGVLLEDVVGLGKTLMATALARVFQDLPRSLETPRPFL